MTNKQATPTAVADAYAAAATAYRSLRLAATNVADELKRGQRYLPDENCSCYLEGAFTKLRHAIRLADSCKLDAAVAIVAMSAYASSDVATAVYNTRHLSNEAAYLDVVRAATEAYETCDQAETIFHDAVEPPSKADLEWRAAWKKMCEDSRKMGGHDD